MKRIITASLFALVLGSCCFAKAPKKEIGIQLYSVRELIGTPEKYANNHESVLAELASYGYTSVEPANYKDGLFYGVSPKQFKADCAAAGLKVISSHTNHGLSSDEYEHGNFRESLAWWKEAIKAHKATGMKYIVMPGMKRPESLAELKFFCSYLNEIGKLCKEQGIKFGYHNHSWELAKLEDEVILEYMIQNTNPDLVFFEMDVYWAVVGDASPVYFFNRYPGRFPCLHIKDWREVGQSGMVGFDAIFANAGIAGLKDYVVEMEASSYGDILRTARESAEYLLNAKFVKKSYK